MMGFTGEVDEETLTMKFRDGLDKSSIMKPYLHQYDMNRFLDGKENDYQYLYQLAHRVNDEQILRQNSLKLSPQTQNRWASAKGFGLGAKGGKDKGKGKKGKDKGKGKQRDLVTRLLPLSRYLANAEIGYFTVSATIPIAVTITIQIVKAIAALSGRLRRRLKLKLK